MPPTTLKLRRVNLYNLSKLFRQSRPP